MVNFTKAFELLRAARSAAGDLGSAPVAQMLLDLQGQLLQLQVHALEQQFEGRALEENIARLRASLRMQRKLERSRDHYLLIENNFVRGPFCTTCWDQRDELQLLIDADDNQGYCPVCRAKAESHLQRSPS